MNTYLTTRHLASEGPVSSVGYPCGPAKIDRARLPGFVLSSSLLLHASAISAGSVTCIICMSKASTAGQLSMAQMTVMRA